MNEYNINIYLVPSSFSEDSIVPTVYAESTYYETERASNLLKDDMTIWNAGHLDGWDVDNWCCFDFEEPIRITEIALRSCGDVIHDAKAFNLDISDYPNGPWRTIATYQVYYL